MGRKCPVPDVASILQRRESFEQPAQRHHHKQVDTSEQRLSLPNWTDPSMSLTICSAELTATELVAEGRSGGDKADGGPTAAEVAADPKAIETQPNAAEARTTASRP